MKLFDSLTGSFSRWQIWDDMVILFATTISNAVDKRRWEKREKLYLETIRRYSPEQQTVFAELFARLVLTIEETAQEGKYCDFLGELFMELGLGNDAGGQFFTPYDVCIAMAEMTIPDNVQEEIERRKYISIHDCACGAGATLIAAADVLKRKGINFQQKVIFSAQDIDFGTALMCYIQLSLIGCAGFVRVGNTITDPMVGDALFGCDDDRTWFTPMYFSTRWHMLRTIEQARRLFRTVATPLPEAAAELPTGNLPAEETAVKAVSEAKRIDIPEKPARKKREKPKKEELPPEVEQEEIIYTIKKNGQLSMFG